MSARVQKGGVAQGAARAVSADALLRREEYFRLALEAAPTGMIMVDADGKIVLVNAQVERLFGFDRLELVGQPVEVLVPVRFRDGHPAFRTGFFHGPKSRPMGAGRDLFGLRKDGTELPIEIGLNPLSTPDGDFVLSSIVDITERKCAEREREKLVRQLQVLNAELEVRVEERTAVLTETLKEREVLLQEVHHRVKNNLQVISSMINMHMRRLENEVARNALDVCRTRVHAIALIHEKLYQFKDYAQVPFADYVGSLATNIFHVAGGAERGISLDLAVEDVALAVDQAIPCGLILSELLTNALKHAFPEGRRGVLHVGLGRSDSGLVTLLVTDDGIGLPRDFDLGRAKSLGLQLVTTLAKQLDAGLEVASDNGMSVRLTFQERSA